MLRISHLKSLFVSISFVAVAAVTFLHPRLLAQINHRVDTRRDRGRVGQSYRRRYLIEVTHVADRACGIRRTTDNASGLATACEDLRLAAPTRSRFRPAPTYSAERVSPTSFVKLDETRSRTPDRALGDTRRDRRYRGDGCRTACDRWRRHVISTGAKIDGTPSLVP